ncbi:hypothetical protein ACLMJK_001408 [Lecanora helva]
MASGRILYFLRIAQLLFGIGFLILISDASVHRGWWDNINGAVAVGVVATVATFALTLHGLIVHHLKKNPFSGGSTIRTVIRLALEIIVFLLWVAAVALMLRGKDGCDDVVTDKKTGIKGCIYEDERKDKLYSDRPLARWDIGIAFAFVEIVTFLASTFFVFKEDRATKGSGNASYA